MGAGASSEIIEKTAAGNLEKVKKVFESDIDRSKREVDKTSIDALAEHNPVTALHVACIKNFIDIAAFLLEKGWDPTETDFEGNNCLHQAIDRNEAQYSDGREMTPTSTGNIVSLILNPKWTSPERAAKLIGAKNKYGETPLHLAVSRCYYPIVNMLLNLAGESDAINAQDNEGNTLIHSLCYRPASTWNTATSKILEEILAAGGFKKKNAKDKHGNYALHIAASQGTSPHAVAELVSNGFDANVTINDGPDNATPLIIASFKNNTEIAQILLACSNKQFQTQTNKVSAISVALERGNVEMIMLLMANGCKPYIRPGFHLEVEEKSGETKNVLQGSERQAKLDGIASGLEKMSVAEWCGKYVRSSFRCEEDFQKVFQKLMAEK